MFQLDTLEFNKVKELIKPYAKTKLGALAILNLEPKTDILECEKLLNETLEANTLYYRHKDIMFEYYDNVDEVLELVNKGSIIEPLDLLKVLALINSVTMFKNYSDEANTNNIKINYLASYFDNLKELIKLRQQITLTINQDGKVIDSASKKLFEIRRKKNQTENKIRQVLNSIIVSNINKLNSNLVVLRDNRLCLAVKLSYKNQIKGKIHDISQSKETCYIEPYETLELASEIDELVLLEKEEIKVIMTNMSLLIRTYYEDLVSNLANLTIIDTTFAKAIYAKDEGIKPNLSLQNFNLVNIKHPLIPKDRVVPISINLTNKEKGIIITGPNTGGKTVALKTVGLSSIMAQSGLLLNAKKDSTVMVFKSIYADIGDEQSIEESLSTFSGHLVKLINILKEDLQESLVLIDELGSGTDPKEGSSLALAILDELINKNAHFIVSTHYSDLKNYAYQTTSVKNASVEFNSKTLMPTYRLILGVPGESCALKIASNLGLSQNIIEKANDYLSGKETSFEIKEYEEKLREVTILKEDNLKLEEYYNELISKLNEEKRNLELQRSKVLKEAQNEKKKIIEKAKEEAMALIKEITELKADNNYKDHVLADLKYKVKNIGSNEEESNLFNEELKIGDYVYIKSYEKYGYVTKIKKDSYEVNFGQFSMSFKRNDLIISEKPKPVKEKKKLYAGYNQVNGAKLSLDLRGKRYEEVKDLIDDFIDKACLANYQEVSIIHGYGTGVVRKRTLEVLKQNPNVKSYRFGGEGEGLNGATVVTLK